MRENSRIHFIPPIPKREEKVGIYFRVSTNSAEQLQSLTAQVSHLTKLTEAMPPNGFWLMFIWIFPLAKQARREKNLIVCWRTVRFIN